MIDALRYEWTRIRTIRSTYWLIGVALLLNALIAFSVALASRNDPLSTEITGAVLTGGSAYSPLPMAAVILAVMGILATGHEYRYGTIQPTLTTVPQRTRLLVAKVTVIAVVAAITTAASMLVNLGIGMIYWDEVPDLTDQPLDAALPGYLLLVVLWTALGAALAQLFRGVPSALVVILVTPLIVEVVIFRLSLVPALDWLAPVVKFLPFTAGQQLVDLSGSVAGTSADEFDLFSPWPAGGVFATFVVIMLAIAGTLLRRRDA